MLISFSETSNLMERNRWYFTKFYLLYGVKPKMAITAAQNLTWPLWKFCLKGFFSSIKPFLPMDKTD
jgi:hypothetical protein